MEPVNLVRVFVASPSDMELERKSIFKACYRLNAELGDYLKVRLEPIGWETHAIPSMDLAPQPAIFQQIPFDRLDLFVGVVAGRFGTPTANAGSGTEEEFERALQLHSATGKPHIMLYFGDKPVQSTKQNLDQLQKVADFRDARASGLYYTYASEGAASAEQVFGEMFHSHLAMWLTKSAPAPPREADISAEFKVMHLTLGDFEWMHLLNLWKEDPNAYEPRSNLEGEMRVLERMQLIRFKNQSRRLDRLPAKGAFLLSEFIELTDVGRKFILWRCQFTPYDERWYPAESRSFANQVLVPNPTPTNQPNEGLARERGYSA